MNELFSWTPTAMQAIAWVTLTFFALWTVFLAIGTIRLARKRYHSSDYNKLEEFVLGDSLVVPNDDLEFLDTLTELRYGLDAYPEGWPLPTDDYQAELDQHIADLMMKNGLLN